KRSSAAQNLISFCVHANCKFDYNSAVEGFVKLVIFVLGCAMVAGADDMGVLRNLAENKFELLRGMPTCVTMAVESGDPTKGASVIVFKGTAGCTIPWHWHTPTEQVMIVSGSAKVEMKASGKTAVLGPGGFAMMPSKHVHQFTC